MCIRDRSRTEEQVDVGGFPVRVKVGEGRAKVEHDDAARVARRLGVSRREVVDQAQDAWRRRGTDAPAEVPYIHGDEHRHDHDHDHSHSHDHDHVLDERVEPTALRPDFADDPDEPDDAS